MEDACYNLSYIEQKCKSNPANRCRLYKRLKKQYGKAIIDISSKKKRDLLIPKQLAEEFLYYYHNFGAVRPKAGEVYAFFSSNTNVGGREFIHLKIGMTKSWDVRKKTYVGPSRVMEEILVFRCKDKRSVETQLKVCLKSYAAVAKEWFLIPVEKKDFVCRLLKRVVNRTVMKSLHKELFAPSPLGSGS